MCKYAIRYTALSAKRLMAGIGQWLVWFIPLAKRLGLL